MYSKRGMEIVHCELWLMLCQRGAPGDSVGGLSGRHLRVRGARAALGSGSEFACLSSSAPHPSLLSPSQSPPQINKVFFKKVSTSVPPV